MIVLKFLQVRKETRPGPVLAVVRLQFTPRVMFDGGRAYLIQRPFVRMVYMEGGRWDADLPYRAH